MCIRYEALPDPDSVKHPLSLQVRASVEERVRGALTRADALEAALEAEKASAAAQIRVCGAWDRISGMNPELGGLNSASSCCL
jgi:hypothetical protein